MTRLFIPGRIEVLGKHTDYAGGRSLLAAVDRGFTVTADPMDGDRIVVVSVPGESVAVSLTPETGGALPPEPGWAVYVRTVVRRLARDFPGRLRGCRIELSSDLPSAAGLSSSSALITGLVLALDAVCGFSRLDEYRAAIPDRADLAGYLSAVERGSPFPGLGPGTEGVGTRGGSEDHVAILCAVPNALVRFRFEPVQAEGVVPLPDGYRFALAASGVRAVKTGSARGPYNRLSDEAARAAALWRERTGRTEPHLGAILDAVGLVPFLEVVGDAAPPEEGERLERRVRHFAAESRDLVVKAGDALAAGNLARFGELVDRSQGLAEELLGNQVPETEHLARSARRLGAVAASAFGAGFGGSVWALVEASADEFLAAWRADYVHAFPARGDAGFFTTSAAAPARTL